MSGRKKAVIIIVIIAIAAAALSAYYFFFGKGSRAEGEAVFAQSVRSLTAAYTPTERFSGVVETQKTSETEFDTERSLDELFVAVGDIVEEGDKLFSYDTEDLKLEIEQLELEIDKLNMDINSSNEEINALNANLEKANSEDKPEYLASIKQLQADIAQARYDIKTKQSEISRKEASIRDSVEKAKMGGIVERIADAQDIKDGKNFKEDGSEDNVLIVIRAEGDFRVKGKADETSIGSLYTDMEVIVRSRIDETAWHGQIATIDTRSPETDDSDSYYYGGDTETATRFSFYVELDSTEGILLGQHVIIEPDYGQADVKTGIWLNSGFIVSEGDNTFVWAAGDEDSALEKRAVTTGDYDADSDEYEITSGLSEDELIAWPSEDCAEGLPVTTEYRVGEDDYAEDSESYDSGSYASDEDYEDYYDMQYDDPEIDLEIE